MSGVDLTSNGTICGSYDPANLSVGQFGPARVKTSNLSGPYSLPLSSLQAAVLILELNPFREDLGPPEGKGGGVVLRSATLLWALASEGLLL